MGDNVNYSNSKKDNIKAFKGDCGHISMTDIYIILMLMLGVCYVVDLLTRRD